MIRDLSNMPPEAIEKMSDEQLRQTLKDDMDVGLGMAILREMSARDLKRATRPHWTSQWGFWVGLVACLAAVAAAYFAWLAEVRVRAVENAVKDLKTNVAKPSPASPNSPASKSQAKP